MDFGNVREKRQQWHKLVKGDFQTIAHGTVLRFHWVGHSVRLKSKCATGNPLLSLYQNLVQESGFELAKLSIRITDSGLTSQSNAIINLICGEK